MFMKSLSCNLNIILNDNSHAITWAYHLIFINTIICLCVGNYSSWFFGDFFIGISKTILASFFGIPSLSIVTIFKTILFRKFCIFDVIVCIALWEIFILVFFFLFFLVIITSLLYPFFFQIWYFWRHNFYCIMGNLVVFLLSFLYVKNNPSSQRNVI